MDRLTIQQAARELGVSEGAVRKRVKRGTIRHEKGSDGRVYVFVDSSSIPPDSGGTRGDIPGVDEVPHPHSNALISQMESEIAYLREENQRKDEIIMQQALTMRQLSAPVSSEAPESPETVSESSEGSYNPPGTGGTQTASQGPQPPPPGAGASSVGYAATCSEGD